MIVHDRYSAYDSAAPGELTHQLCLRHTLRDLAPASSASATLVIWMLSGPGAQGAAAAGAAAGPGDGLPALHHRRPPRSPDDSARPTADHRSQAVTACPKPSRCD
ncbi:hypothetical protein ACIP4U_33890 [Streptomyces caelestis]|uniref:hypothetical protein n=1 Tax=Streptomyces caelestis TaxID=36816 RepID=UPI003804AA0C